MKYRGPICRRNGKLGPNYWTPRSAGPICRQGARLSRVQFASSHALFLPHFIRFVKTSILPKQTFHEEIMILQRRPNVAATLLTESKESCIRVIIPILLFFLQEKRSQITEAGSLLPHHVCSMCCTVQYVMYSCTVRALYNSLFSICPLVHSRKKVGSWDPGSKSIFGPN